MVSLFRLAGSQKDSVHQTVFAGKSIDFTGNLSCQSGTVKMYLHPALLIPHLNFNKTAVAAFFPFRYSYTYAIKRRYPDKKYTSVEFDSIMYMCLKEKYSKKIKKLQKLY